ncbi:MAG TPA: hypothetical protein P5556_08565 [Candidatus Gastranaerophilales bacterium]|nr:hypothetical protein [Candidatus Gastranaerophilales bacterium]
MKKIFLSFGLMFLLAQPALSQCGCPVNPRAPQAVLPVPMARQINPCCPQIGTYPGYMTGAASPICCPQQRSAWRVFVEDYLGF